MRNPGGYGLTTYADGRGPDEEDTFTCVHCNVIVAVSPRTSPTDLGGWCACCAKPICKSCAGKPCMPFEKKIAIMENRARFFRSIGLV